MPLPLLRNTCDSPMEHHLRNWFISIALSFLTGYLACCNIFTSEASESHFGSLAEDFSFNEYLQDLEAPTLSADEFSTKNHVGSALRNFSQTKRFNTSSTSKLGVAFIKRNHVPHILSLKIESVNRFFSRLTEARKHLISLGKLII